MGKAAFGEYAAFDTQGGIRFQKNNKLTSEKAIPPEVVAYLKKSLGVSQAQIVPPVEPAQRFPMPTEEEKRALREESLRVKPELEGIPDAITEEQIATQVPAPVIEDDEPLTPDDFDVPEAPVPAHSMSEHRRLQAVGAPTAPPLPVAPVPNDPDVLHAEQDADPMSEFMESVSIHTASLEDMVTSLYERFGIYTVYLGRLPSQDEINPITGEIFTKYHLGIAYQAAIRAQNSGILQRPAEEGRRLLDEGRWASANLPLDTPPQTQGDLRRTNSFDYRMSPAGDRVRPTTEIIHVMGADGVLHAEQRNIEVVDEDSEAPKNGATSRWSESEDEPIVQPNFSGKPIIRPNW